MRVFNRLSAAIVCACCIAITFAQGNVAPEVPLSVAFAGQIVELNRFDRVERMDRELLSMMYGHTNTFLTIKRANRYIPELKEELKKHNVPEDFVYLAAVESHFDETAKSPAKAAGFWQFVPTTAREYGLEVNNFVDERYDYIKATISKRHIPIINVGLLSQRPIMPVWLEFQKPSISNSNRMFSIFI